MIERVFLGWDGPFADHAAGWLLAHKDALPGWLVITPTAQSGRRLRGCLAGQAGALLAPLILTPGALMHTAEPAVAADWMEHLAWLETLEAIGDWSPYQELFPQPPDAADGRASALAAELAGLRRRLQENGHTLASAAKRLANSIEAGRWNALARLEALVERQLNSWGLLSRSRLLAAGVKPPQGITAVVLAGVTDAPPLLERALREWNGPVTALIGAPECEAENFSDTGRPLDGWSSRTLPWPAGEQGSVVLAADVRQEAAEALRAVAQAGTPAGELALGATDAAGGAELAQAFTRAGWVAFHPAEPSIPGGLRRWFRLWSAWLAEPLLATAADLLALPETSALIRGSRAEKARRLAMLRDQWMARRPDDLRLRMQTADFRSAEQQEAAAEVLQAIETLERWRASFSRGNHAAAMEQLLERLATASEDSAAEAAALRDWLAEAAPLLERVRRDTPFWIDLMLGALPTPAPTPPDGRVIDVHGWLELFFEPGRHLVLCGLNEGKAPARNAGDPWLGEAAASLLGLPGNRQRAARDAFLHLAMIEARRHGGRVDLLCAKTGPDGDPLLPSRLLLAADAADLPERVNWLFRGIEPPEAGMRWHADWQWQPPAVEIPRRLSVTSLRDWLACPFRFYLKHALGMQQPDPGRGEWDARDFGNIAHEILERWGSDPVAREFDDPADLHASWCNDLDRILASRFGSRPPLAMRIQGESLRQRLAWLAQAQAAARADGWQVAEVEHKIEIQLGAWTLVAKIDRIDRHATSGALRVIDYKTGKVGKVDAEHRSQVTANTKLPAHIPADSPVVHPAGRNGKDITCRWSNLQLPLYAAAVRQRDGLIPEPCYFTIGETESHVALTAWPEFSAADLDAAMACAAWIVGRIEAGEFWPPAEKSRYDDFASLAAGRKLADLCQPPAQV